MSVVSTCMYWVHNPEIFRSASTVLHRHVDVYIHEHTISDHACNACTCYTLFIECVHQITYMYSMKNMYMCLCTMCYGLRLWTQLDSQLAVWCLMVDLWACSEGCSHVMSLADMHFSVLAPHMYVAGHTVQSWCLHTKNHWKNHNL